MPRPNDSAAIAEYVKGLREAKAAFQQMPEIVRDRLNDATEMTVREISRLGKVQVQRSPSIRTRALLNAIGWSMNRKNGRGRAGIMAVSTIISNPTLGAVGKTTIKVKGILIPGKGGSARTSKGAKLIRPQRYAHFVEFGTRKMPAEPFMIPAAKSQEQPYLDRCKARGPEIVKDMGAIGLRYV